MPTNAHSTQGRQFLQARLELFSRAMFAVAAACIGLGNLYLLGAGHLTFDEVLTGINNFAGGLSLVIIGVTWALARSGPRSLSTLQALDGTSFLGIAVCIIAIGVFYPFPAQRDLTILLCLFGVIMVRTAVVPSTALRTGVLSAIAMGLGAAATVWRHAVPHADTGLDPAVAGFTAIGYGILITSCAAFFSGVIFRLRDELEHAERLGQYTLLHKVGEGGVGQVYRAKHARLKRPTAIKIVRPGVLDDATLARFEREAQLTARLRHPNTVTVYDYGRTDEGTFYYAMEYLSGLNLDELVELEGEQPAARVVHILRQVVAALEEAHGLGLVHRDIKPSNIIVSFREGIGDTAKLVDFGLVKPLGEDAATLTHKGSIVGTPAYMAPETVLAPDEVDGRSDLYAVGAVAYFLLTGRHVFVAPSVPAVVYKHVHDEPEPPSTIAERAIPEDLERLVLHCLQKAPADRPPSAAWLLEALDGCEAAGRWSASDARVYWEDVPGTDEFDALEDAPAPRLSIPPVIRPGRDS